jgi:hypothetical protein
MTMHRTALRASLALASTALLACAAVSDVETVGTERDGGAETGGGREPVRDAGGGVETGLPTDAAIDTAPDTTPADAEADTAADTAVDAAPDLAPTDAAADATPDTAPDTGTPETPVGDECEQVSAVAVADPSPVDIIWAIDTSGSMDDEVELVQNEIDDFVEYLGLAAGLDYRVIVISAPSDVEGGSFDVCIPEPLSGAPGCPDTDGPQFRHVRQYVGSHNGLEVIAESWPLYSDFLRADSIKHFVIVTDDEADSGTNARWFERSMGPLLPEGFVFHSIVSTTETEDCFLFICETAGCSGPYGDAEAQGSTYMDLSTRTGGVAASICDPDWNAIFDDIARTVVSGATLACEFEIPPAPFGEILFDAVRVEFIETSGTRTALTQVANAAACTSDSQWYYDDPAAPTRVLLCPAACGEREGAIEIFFDCIKA